MEPFPHHYAVTASGTTTNSHVIVSSGDLSDITTDVPAEFGGPGDQWSPESLLMAAVADCFVLTFRAIAQASKLQWNQVCCEATGTLDRVDRKPQFTTIQLQITLHTADDVSEEKAQRVLEKAEQGCLITNSLNASVSITTDIKHG
jgi:peroxiredoxin-like protein